MSDTLTIAETPTNRAKVIRALLLLLALVPPGVAGFLIDAYGVDHPFWDQWEIATIFVKAHDGTLSFGDLFAQHNESRKFFPRLIFLFLGRLSGWNVKWEMAASLVAACCTMVSLVWLHCRTHDRGRFSALGLLAASVLVFSPVQHENWVWGIQLVVFLPIACLSIGLAAAYTTWPIAVRGGVCGLLATVATYSYANGMLCWPLLLPALLLATEQTPRRRRVTASLWTCAALLEIGLYFYDYHKPAGSPPFKLSGESVRYFLAFCGSPLARWGDEMLGPATIIGAIMVVAWAVVSVYVVRYRQDDSLPRRSLLPWLILGAYTIASGAITAAGRSADGAGQALAGRYTTFAIILPVALVMLFPMIETDLRRMDGWRSKFLRACGITFAVALIATQLGAFGRAVDDMGGFSLLRLRGKAAVAWVRLSTDDPALSRTYPDVNALRDRATALDRLGLIRPPLIDPAATSRAWATDVRPADFGRLLAPVRLGNGKLLCRGWSRLPGRREPSDAVILTAEGAGAAPRFVGISTLKQEIPNVAETTGVAEYAFAGWQIVSLPDQTSNGETLRAWSYDAKTGRAYPLEGAYFVP
jgi:hypothetical protein